MNGYLFSLLSMYGYMFLRVLRVPNNKLIQIISRLEKDISSSIICITWVLLDLISIHSSRLDIRCDILISYSRGVRLISIRSHLMSNTFIQLVHCSWLFPYLIVSVISILSIPWYYLYINYIINFYLLNFWIRDNIREYTSTYDILIEIFFVVFCILVVSESLFFITFFWSSFHTSCSLIWIIEGLYLSDPNELTFTNTVLLSNSGLSLGCTYLIRVTHILHHLLCLLSFLLAFTFISLQIKEFRNITLYMNESIYSCVFFFLTSLHLFHVIVGILLIGLIICTSCYSRSVLNFILFQLRVIPYHLFYTLQLVYWHLVELLWLFIYYVLYS